MPLSAFDASVTTNSELQTVGSGLFVGVEGNARVKIES